MTATRISVAVTTPYDVVIGRGALDDLPSCLPAAVTAAARRAAVVTTAEVAGHYAAAVTAGLESVGLTVNLRLVPDGEAAKSLTVLGQLYDWLASIPLARTDLVVSLGGGVVTDLAGFLAATWHRGVPVLHVPTTLLAQVDAAIGGKTAVNLAAGKNLVGAFHQPVAVVADVVALATLPVRELRAGMAEVVKCGFIRDADILTIIERDPAAALDPTGEVLPDLVHRAAAVKSAVVATDTHEHGERALLNYGHTLGHALETITGYARYRHGEAVGLGMRFAATVSELIALADVGLERRTVRILEAVGLPVRCDPLDAATVLAVMARDKKVRDGLRLVLCAAPGDARVVSAPVRAVLERALAAVQDPPTPPVG
jgi:3-dehydroquinate synthase